MMLGVDSASTLMPAASGKPPLSSMESRTGRRCTTLTQLPEEFSGGSSEKLEPVPGLVLSPWP